MFCFHYLQFKSKISEQRNNLWIGFELASHTIGALFIHVATLVQFWLIFIFTIIFAIFFSFSPNHFYDVPNRSLNWFDELKYFLRILSAGFHPNIFQLIYSSAFRIKFNWNIQRNPIWVSKKERIALWVLVKFIYFLLSS